MPTSETSDAQAAYAIQRALVELRMEELRKALDKHEARRPLKLSDARDMEHVEAMLAAIVWLLGQRP